MNTRTRIDTPAVPLLRRASTLIAMGAVGLALVAAGPAGAEDTKPATKPKLRTAVPPTTDQVLWEPIRDRTNAISFEATSTTTTTTPTPELVRDDWYQSQTRLGQRPLVVRPR